ncbi:hypothetical protein NQ318_015315 [Aromia moschata]|uniref:Mos1 transposase HTH domain-containing protein n=1 Tax=Aromia moschata TaxID=1265417 RepID=A0AAV8XVD3_9CUCU|nr:hypothetical protein NQ318_015315 [Aromia moschata]
MRLRGVRIIRGNETGNVAPELVTLRRRDLERRLVHSATDTFAKLQHAYGDSFSRPKVFQWFKTLSEGRESIEDKPRSLHLQEPMKMSIEYRICIQIVG